MINREETIESLLILKDKIDEIIDLSLSSISSRELAILLACSGLLSTFQTK